MLELKIQDGSSCNARSMSVGLSLSLLDIFPENFPQFTMHNILNDIRKCYTQKEHFFFLERWHLHWIWKTCDAKKINNTLSGSEIVQKVSRTLILRWFRFICDVMLVIIHADNFGHCERSFNSALLANVLARLRVPFQKKVDQILREKQD